jgi:hypothetical protein
MPGYEFTDTEREFMIAVDNLVDTGVPIDDSPYRIGEEYVRFMPTTRLSICANVIIGFASRPIGGADMGLYGADGISAYHVNAYETFDPGVTAGHLFHLRGGAVWHRRRTYRNGRHKLDLLNELPEYSTYGMPLTPEGKEDLISWLSKAIQDPGIPR